MENIEKFYFDLPESLEPIAVPVQVGPSVFPNNIDQLKTIDYSSVPNDSILEAKLSRYYQLLSVVASNQATEEDLSELQRILLDVRNYVLTEEDFNLMADAVRTTQIYLKNAAEANINNYKSVSVVLKDFVENMQEWTQSLNQRIDNIGTIPSLATGLDYSFGPNQPTQVPNGYENSVYYWCDTSNENFILKKANVEEGGKLTSFSEVSLNPSQKTDIEKFTRAADIFKRKTVISTLENRQASQTTNGIGQTIDESLLENTTENDLVLEELKVGTGGEYDYVSNVDDLVDGRFEYGLKPIGVEDINSLNYQSYPENEGNYQGGAL